MRLSVIAALAVAASSALAQPVIFWASDPVLPDDTVLVTGHGFGETPVVELAEVSADMEWTGDPIRPEVLQPCDTSVKFVIPADWKPGAYAVRVIGPEGASKDWLLNLPTVYWCQGDQGSTASPGGWVRIFGRCIAGEGKSASITARGVEAAPMVLSEMFTVKESSPWFVTLAVSAACPAGEYEFRVWNGYGGDVAEVKPTIRVAVPDSWPDRTYNVRDFGAEGQGDATDDFAIRAAVAKAEADGGGVVYFPRGRYQINGTLSIPRNTVLRGEATHLSCVLWPDSEEPYDILTGKDHFGIEDLTIYCTNYRHVIASDQSEPQQGNIFLRRVRVRADLFRGHLSLDEVAERFRVAMRNSTGCGDTVRLGGPNIEITDCDLYGSGRSLYLLRPRSARVTGNTFYNGRWGWYCIDGPDGLILERNTITSADLMSTGGSLNCYTSAYAQNVYYADNRLERCHGWDREAMTTDAGGGAYFGTATEIGQDAFTFTAEPTWRGKRDWTGAGVFILSGRGMGQYRRVASYEDRKVTLDRPWDVLPDEASQISITMFQGRYLFVNNSFEDVGIALQYYGTSIDNVAVGNTCSRGGGFYNSGRWYHHFQPSWYCQFLGNVISEGNAYRFGANNATSAGASYIGTHGIQSQSGTAPLALASVHRRNHLQSNAELQFVGINREHPGVKDVVAEHNLIENADRGAYMDPGCQGVLLRENTFRSVVRELVTEEEIARELAERRKDLLDRQDPVVHYTFDAMAGDLAGNAAGNQFPAKATGKIALEPGVSGMAPHFDGSTIFKTADRQMLQFPRITVSAWIRPDTIKGRWGFVAKRAGGGVTPYVLAVHDGRIEFNGADALGKWSYNLLTRPCVTEKKWQHIAAVCEESVSVKVYCNGELVGEKAVTEALGQTDDILTVGYENWGGEPAKAGNSGNFRGLVDEVKIWSRLLTPEEVAAEYQALKAQGEADDARRAAEQKAAEELTQQFSGGIVEAGGVDWQLVLADGFDRAALGTDWKSLRGTWTLQDGTLRCGDVSYLGCAKPVKAPVRIEYDARATHPGDLTAFWGTERDAYLGGYFIGFASNGNSANKILRLGEDVISNEAPVATPDKWHHVIAQVIGGKVQLIVDGKLALEYTDPKPLTEPDMAGILAWGEGEFDNVRIYTGAK